MLKWLFHLWDMLRLLYNMNKSTSLLTSTLTLKFQIKQNTNTKIIERWELLIISLSEMHKAFFCHSLISLTDNSDEALSYFEIGKWSSFKGMLSKTSVHIILTINTGNATLQQEFQQDQHLLLQTLLQVNRLSRSVVKHPLNWRARCQDAFLLVSLYSLK